MGNSVLDAMMEAMLKNTSSKLMTGDYSVAIDESTKYLSSIEGLKPEVKTAYALILLLSSVSSLFVTGLAREYSGG